MLSPDEGLVVPHADREAACARAQAKRAAAFEESSSHRGNCRGCGLAFRSRFAPPSEGTTTHYADGQCQHCAAARAEHEQEPAPEPVTVLPVQTTLFDLGGDARP